MKLTHGLHRHLLQHERRRPSSCILPRGAMLWVPACHPLSGPPPGAEPCAWWSILLRAHDAGFVMCECVCVCAVHARRDATRRVAPVRRLARNTLDHMSSPDQSSVLSPHHC